MYSPRSRAVKANKRRADPIRTYIQNIGIRERPSETGLDGVSNRTGGGYTARDAN